MALYDPYRVTRPKTHQGQSKGANQYIYFIFFLDISSRKQESFGITLTPSFLNVVFKFFSNLEIDLRGCQIEVVSCFNKICLRIKSQVLELDLVAISTEAKTTQFIAV